MKSGFSLRPNKPRSQRPRMGVVMGANTLAVLKDGAGTVIFGWAGQGVLYTRFKEGLTAQNGQAYSARLAALVVQASAIHFFCDFSELTYYDLLARSAFIRAVLSNRRRFVSHTWLMWDGELSPAMRSLATSLGDPVSLLKDRKVFEDQLLKLAPLAWRKLDPKTWEAPKPPQLAQ